jgi:hypothetical protein
MRRNLSIIAVSIAALAAFVAPSAASAANWGVAGSTHSLTTVKIKYGLPPNYENGWTCDESYTVGVRTPLSSTLDVKNVTYSNCVGYGFEWEGCKFTAKAGKLPWTINGSSPTNAILNVGEVSLSGGACFNPAFGPYSISGSIAGGVWSAPAHSLTYSNASSLTLNLPGGGFMKGIKYSATLVDPLKTLTLF